MSDGSPVTVVAGEKQKGESKSEKANQVHGRP